MLEQVKHPASQAVHVALISTKLPTRQLGMHRPPLNTGYMPLRKQETQAAPWHSSQFMSQAWHVAPVVEYPFRQDRQLPESRGLLQASQLWSQSRHILLTLSYTLR